MALSSTEEVASLRGSGPGYARHDPLAQQAEVLAIRLGTGFGVLRHEIGHMLGLGHEPGSKLMSPHYVGDNQQCIDKATVAALLANRKLSLSSLNWCEG